VGVGVLCGLDLHGLDANNHQGQLLDELDTHNLDKVTVNLLNNIFERDGFVQRRSSQKDAFGKPRNIKYMVNCCCAYALAHGFAETKLPRPTKSRTIVIRVQPSERKLGTGPDDLRRFYVEDAAQVEELQNRHTILWHWAEQAQLNLDPSMPDELLRAHRQPDKLRAMFSLADSRSPEEGAYLRQIAVAMTEAEAEPIVGVDLLYDCRRVIQSGRNCD
jgi:hypothetical protein